MSLGVPDLPDSFIVDACTKNHEVWLLQCLRSVCISMSSELRFYGLVREAASLSWKCVNGTAIWEKINHYTIEEAEKAHFKLCALFGSFTIISFDPQKNGKWAAVA